MKPLIVEIEAEKPFLIAVIHLPPLPGSPGYPAGGNRPFLFEDTVSYAVSEARKAEEAGFNAVIIENYGDKPYAVEPGLSEAVAMTVIAREAVAAVSIPVGINMLRNGGVQALVAARHAGASFIRVNALCETRIAPEGLLQPIARRLAETAARIGALSIAVLADIDVKHSYPVPGYDPIESARDCIERGGADVLVATGKRTGEPPSHDLVAALAATGAPVLVGSGLTRENAATLLRVAAGAIVGSSIKIGGRPENPIDPEKARSLVEAVRGAGLTR